MDYGSLFDTLSQVFTQMQQRVIDFFPNFLGAVAIFLVGLLVAYLLRVLVYRLLNNLGRLIPHKKIQEKTQSAKMERFAGIISKIIYWIVLFLFFTAATETLGLPVVTTWLSGVASYLPRIVAAVLIVVIGVIGGILLRDVVVSSAASAGFAQAMILGKLAQYAIVLVSVLVGIRQLGIDISFLTHLIIIFITAVLFGAALAFGLGARVAISNILASYYLQKTYKVGHSIKIGGRQGRIVRITPTAVILESSEGALHVPAKQFSERASLLLKGEGV